MDELELNVPLDFSELLVELNDIGRPKTIHHNKNQLIDFKPYEKKIIVWFQLQSLKRKSEQRKKALCYGSVICF